MRSGKFGNPFSICRWGLTWLRARTQTHARAHACVLACVREGLLPFSHGRKWRKTELTGLRGEREADGDTERRLRHSAADKPEETLDVALLNSPMDQEMISNSKRKSPESNICKQIPTLPPPTPDCLVLEGWVLTQQKISRRRKSPFCMVGFNVPLTPLPFLHPFLLFRAA